MAKSWGKADYKQLLKLRENLGKLQEVDMDKFCVTMSKELAARLLSLVIPATPVGDYAQYEMVTAKRDSKRHKKGEQYRKKVGNPSGKMGGTLRRGWTAHTEEQAASGVWTPDPIAYASGLPITKSGTTYQIEVINPVSYASYVEFGHRQTVGRYVPAIGKQLKQDFIQGQYMLTMSEKEIREHAPEWISQKLEKELKKVFRV